jgi:hypothetical protein
MPTPLTPTPQRTAVSKPIGPDVVNVLAAIGTPLQALLDRSEWAAKSLLDLKMAMTTASDSDYASATFADLGSLSTFTFTDVSVGDKLLLIASSSWKVGTFTADGTDPHVNMRWLAGATDLSLSAAGAYPEIKWGVSIGATPTDSRSMTCMAMHTAVASGSLVCKAQARTDGAVTIVNTHTVAFGFHVRSGAA